MKIDFQYVTRCIDVMAVAGLLVSGVVLFSSFQLEDDLAALQRLDLFFLIYNSSVITIGVTRVLELFNLIRTFPGLRNNGRFVFTYDDLDETIIDKTLPLRRGLRWGLFNNDYRRLRAANTVANNIETEFPTKKIA